MSAAAVAGPPTRAHADAPVSSSPSAPAATTPAATTPPAPPPAANPVFPPVPQPSPAPSPPPAAPPTARPPARVGPTLASQHDQPATVDPRPASTVTPAPIQPPTAAQPSSSTPTGHNGVAVPPQLVSGLFGVMPWDVFGTSVSAAALRFYRLPLFLLPIYQAAAIQYAVPWQVLAGINEVETNYGRDLSVSSAGAVGWMQFLPATWLQYGVDATNSGFADPYDPADAIFAAARYLHAAGAQSDLRSALFSYNHSTAYVDSVLLRARLIGSFPEPVIETLTGLAEGHSPVRGARVQEASTGAAPAARRAPQFVTLSARRGGRVVAVADGKVVRIGHSPSLGNYVVLRDVQGDRFIYAGVYSLVGSYRAPSVAAVVAPTRVDRPEQEPLINPRPLPASAGAEQRPVTLAVTAHRRRIGSVARAPGKVRLFARASGTALQAAAAGLQPPGSHRLALRRGSLVTAGTVLGHVSATGPGARGHLRFAIEPAGDTQTVDPRPILANWQLLYSALHPRGVDRAGRRAGAGVLGAGAGSVFLLSDGDLERQVLSDPGISIYPCGRRDLASGVIDRRVLALLAFLSRSGLRPTVAGLRCGHSWWTAEGQRSPHSFGDGVDISAINGVPISGHQGAGSVTDDTIRTLLTLQGQFAPHQIISLMAYPGAPNTLAVADDWDHIDITFEPPAATPSHAAGRAVAAAALAAGPLDPGQWDQLIGTIAALPEPLVSGRRSAAAVPDPQAAPGSPSLGAAPALAAGP